MCYFCRMLSFSINSAERLPSIFFVVYVRSFYMSTVKLTFKMLTFVVIKTRVNKMKRRGS